MSSNSQGPSYYDQKQESSELPNRTINTRFEPNIEKMAVINEKVDFMSEHSRIEEEFKSVFSQLEDEDSSEVIKNVPS